MTSKRLTPLLFEIASPARMAILEATRERPMRHAEIAERLEVSGAEATRHLQRLSRVGLLARDSRGAFSESPLAKASRPALESLGLLAARPEYFARHDLADLPTGFAARVGELRDAPFLTDPFEVMAAQHEQIQRAQGRLWVLADASFLPAQPSVAEKARAGLDVRLLLTERPDSVVRSGGRGVPDARRIERAPAHLVIADDRASLAFPGLEHRVDLSSAFQLARDAGLAWAEDLFDRLWSRPSLRIPSVSAVAPVS